MFGGERLVGRGLGSARQSPTAKLVGLGVAVGLLVAVSTGSAAEQRLVKGTARADTLVGTPRSDTILGLKGDDWLRGLGGDDVLVGGPGRDIVSGGPGNDRILTRDGARDRVYCGLGKDRVVADRLDRVHGDCETRLLPSDEPPPLPPPSGMKVVQVDQSWTCSEPVDLDLVKITMTSSASARDAVHLRSNCSGLIRRIEIETWAADGVKINAPAPATHDLLIGGGYIRCFDHAPGVHQDGVQALGGTRITFRNVEINCNSLPNAQFFISAANAGLPTDVVCERCFLGSGAASTIGIGESVRSGVRNSTLCPGRFHNINIVGGAVDPVITGNTLLAAGDSRC